MKKRKAKNSLLSPEATGGDTAETGFQYQASLIAARVPCWLKQEGFTEAIREALGDAEASFFIPEKGISREFIEYKNHRLTPSEFWPEIKRFLDMDESSPEAFHKFVLACTGVSDDIKPMMNALRRVRDAYPFYQSAPTIQNASYSEYQALVNNLDPHRDPARFIFEKVSFEIDLTDAENFAREKFREALFGYFPEFQNYPGKASTEAFLNVTELIQSRKNQPIRRQELEKAIFSTVGSDYRPNRCVLIHTSNDESNANRDTAICFNWIAFFGGTERVLPKSDDWNNGLLKQLNETKKWILSTGRPHRICLSGNRRLSASLAIGSVFSAVSGFDIDVEVREEIWRTDGFPSSDTPDYSWSEIFIGGQAVDEMVLGIGVLQDVREDLERFVKTIDFSGPRFYLFGENPLVSDQQTNIAVGKIKQLILSKIALHKINKIHLFIAGPTQLALFLGHRLNSTCSVQCYERQADYSYVPTCLLHF